MNITELKELAEKATPGPWLHEKENVHTGGVCSVNQGGEPWFEVWSPNWMDAPAQNNEADAAYIAAANPAEILELIAKLEAAEQTARYESDLCQQALDSRKEMEGQLDDAQGEIRALRATEAGLREMVKALEEVAAAMLPFADDASAINGYGYYRPENPHNFHPDAESCTADEIAAHKAACDAWDAGTYKDNYGEGWVGPGLHILRAPWGIGSYTDEAPEISAICKRARALLEKKE